jgi:cholesterol transport system auxiliary component
MTSVARAALIAATAYLALLPACALLSKSEPFVPRYFSPEAPSAGRFEPVAPSGLELRLGRVNAQASVKASIMRRDSAYEVAYYEERLWTEKPEVYVRRAIARALFDDGGVRHVLSGVATTLDVDVIAFEEVLQPAHVGRVTLDYTLADDREVLLSRRVTVERPIAPSKADDAQAIVAALAGALSAAVDALAVATTAELRVLAQEPASSHAGN